MTTTDRMQDNTATLVAERIAETTRSRVEEAVATGRIDERLGELRAEWDAERLLFTISGVVLLLGAVLSRLVGRRWLVFVAAVAGFQVQHGVQGWCPPFALLRRMGVRTRKEIDEERMALKVVRGDFVHSAGTADDALTATSN